MPKEFKDVTGTSVSLIGVPMCVASLLAFIIGGAVGSDPISYCVPGLIFLLVGGLLLALGSSCTVIIDEVAGTVTVFKTRLWYFKMEERVGPLARFAGARLNYGYSQNRDSHGRATGTTTLVANAVLMWRDGSELSVQCGQDNCFMDKKQDFVSEINEYLAHVRGEAGPDDGDGDGGKKKKKNKNKNSGTNSNGDVSISVQDKEAADYMASMHGMSRNEDGTIGGAGKGLYQPPADQQPVMGQGQGQQVPLFQYLQQQQQQQQQQSAAIHQTAMMMVQQQQQAAIMAHQQQQAMLMAQHQQQQQHQPGGGGGAGIVPTGSVPIVPIPQFNNSNNNNNSADNSGAGYVVPMPDMGGAPQSAGGYAQIQ